MKETETHAEHINPSLKAAGWGQVEGSRIRMDFPINKGRLIGHGQRSKPEMADYILQYKNRNLAVIEAKARDKYYTEGVRQAKDYAGRLLGKEHIEKMHTSCTNEKLAHSLFI